MSFLLQTKNISKKYGHQIVLDKASFSMQEKQRVGFVGRNGSGKSTLFKIIMGLESADSGDVEFSDEVVLGYLEQEEKFKLGESVIDYLLRVSDEPEWECAKVASQFGLDELELNTDVLELSGGYQMRIKLVEMLLKNPNLLLLDEPTNYLDMSTLILLERFLETYNGAYIIISHDREFLENNCQQTLEIEHGKLEFFDGVLTDYEDYKEQKIQTDLKYNQKQQRKKKHMQKFVDRFRYKASKARQAQARIKMIDKIDTRKILEKPSEVMINMPELEKPYGLACRLQDLVVGYDGMGLLSPIELEINKGQHIAILGDNGQGKTTLLKTLAGELEAVDGRVRWMKGVDLAYYAQHLAAEMPLEQTVEGYLASLVGLDKANEEVLAMAGSFLFKDDDLEKQISVLSGGEKSRLCLAGILLQEKNVLLLDEPNNHLDFVTVEALARALHYSLATVIFISHDRTFVEMVADDIWVIEKGKLIKFSGRYTDYIKQLKGKIFGTKRKELNIYKKEYKQRKREKFFALKNAKKSLAKIDQNLVDKNKLKQDLLDKISQNPTEYDAKLYKELDKIEQEIIEIEKDWLAVTQEIEILQ